MNIENDDLHRMVSVFMRIDATRRPGVLLLPSNMVLTDSQLAWCKRNGIKSIEQSGNVVEL